MRKENKLIAKNIRFLSNGKYSERKEYLVQLKENGYCTINGFRFTQDVFCWVVWKPTDSVINPEYKGESLFKVIPKSVLDERQICNILKNQAWIYP